MTEGSSPETPNSKEFTALNPAEQVQAILAAGESPMSRQFVFDIAGIQFDELKEPEQEAVNAAFNSPNIQQTHDEKLGVDQYRIDPEKGQ